MKKLSMKWKKYLLCFLSLLLVVTLAPAAYAEEPEEDTGDRTLAPYFYVEGGDPSADSFPLKSTNVETTINGVIAETYVTQTYANEGQSPINANYVFPASTKVSVHGMKMQIGDKVVTAQIREKEEAKQEFEEAKSEGKSASLLEQQRPNVFTMNVANVMPGDTVKIELHYTELVSQAEGTYEFVFPTVVGPRYASPNTDREPDEDQWVASPYLEGGAVPSGTYNITVNLSTGVPITDLTCKTHKINITRDGDSAARVTLYDPGDYAGNRDFILHYKLTGEKVNCGLMLNAGETENFFMLMVQPPRRLKPEDIPPREYIFVLDVSGSMFGYPLDTAKDLIINLVSNLRETDRFNLILFSNDSIQLAPRSLPATTANIGRAIQLIDQQSGGGGTELAPALKRAAAIPADPAAGNVSRNIVVITDGFMSDEMDIYDIINKNTDTTGFFSFGIGSSVNRYLIEGIAKAGAGESFVVTDSEDATETANRFRTYIQSPVLTDIKVDYDGFDAYDVEPASISTLFAQKPIILFGKWRGEPAGTIRVTGTSGAGDYTQEIPVANVAPRKDNSAIRYLWARTRVESLSDYGYKVADEETVRKEVTKLGLDYSMMTDYTSFVAVIEEVRNPAGESTDVNQPLPLPLEVSDLAVGSGYTIGSEPDAIILMFAAASVFMIGILLRMGKMRAEKRRAIRMSASGGNQDESESSK